MKKARHVDRSLCGHPSCDGLAFLTPLTDESSPKSAGLITPCGAFPANRSCAPLGSSTLLSLPSKRLAVCVAVPVVPK